MSSNADASHARLSTRGNGIRMDAPTSHTFKETVPAERRSLESGAQAKPAPQPRVRIRTVALPVEHGGWGLSLEPVVLGLLVAPTPAGLFLAFATVGAFLARHPLKIAVADRRKGRRFPRTRMAEAFAALYCAFALLSFAAAALPGPTALLLPLGIAAPLAVIQLAYDFTSRSRALLPELSGATAMASVAASIAVAGGWSFAPALALWAILAARVLPTILYVRSRLKAAHGEKGSPAVVMLTHLAACAVGLVLYLRGIASLLALMALTILLLRALVGENSRPVSARRVGISELIYGAVLVAALAAGHWLGI